MFASLTLIGAPSAAPLVDEYVRIWKMPRGKPRDRYLTWLEYKLYHDALLGAALKHIHKLLTKANFGGLDRDELDAVQHLKRELLKGID